MKSLLPAKRSSSFLLVLLFILCTLAIQDCSVRTGVTAIDIASIIIESNQPEYDLDIDPDDFYKSGYDRLLRQGEEVLLYSYFSNRTTGERRKLAITDERVLYWIADDEEAYSYGQKVVYSNSQQSSFIPESVDHIDIRQIELYKIATTAEHSYRLRLHLYGVLEAADYYFVFTSNSQKVEFTQVIQTQVDYINTIRNELGVTIPETVTTSELIKLNEPVIAVLRARRKIK